MERFLPQIRRMWPLILAAGFAAPASFAQQAPAAPPTQAELQLKEMSLAELGDTEVTTVSKEPEEVWHTAAAVYVLTHDDIRRSGATTIPDLLRLVPGVEVAQAQSDAWAVGIRGFLSGFSKGLLVLIDGRSVYTPLFEGVYWDVQDLVFDDIDRIEIIRGPGGAIWGPNAVNGVINIITRKAAQTQGGWVNLTGGGEVEHFTGEVREGLTISPQLQLRMFAKGFNRGPEANPGNIAYDTWHQERGGFRADWQPTTRDVMSASAMVYGGSSGDQNQVGYLNPPAQLTVNGRQLVSGGDLVLRWDHDLAKGSNFYVEGYFDRTIRATSQFTETRNTIDFDFIYHAANLARQDVILGAGLRESPSNITQTQATVNFSPHQINNYVYSLFAQDEIRLVPDRVTLTLGSKFENNNYSGWGVEPSARILWNPTSTSTLWASVSRALRTPGRLDRDLTLIGYAPGPPPIFVEIAGDPTFKPEMLIGWEAGYRQLLAKSVYVDVASFHNQYDNIESYGTVTITTPPLTAPIPLITVPYANGIRGVTDGFEIAPDWKPAKWFSVRGSYSHLHIALHSKPGYSADSYASGYEGSSPDRQVSVQSVFALPWKFEVVPDYRYVSALPAQSIPSYQTADGRISWRYGAHLELAANGRNLLQPAHLEETGDNSNLVGIRRSIYGGARVSW